VFQVSQLFHTPVLLSNQCFAELHNYEESIDAEETGSLAAEEPQTDWALPDALVQYYNQARHVHGVKSFQKEDWPDEDTWKSQGVVSYQEVKDTSGVRKILLKFQSKLTPLEVQKRLVLLHIRAKVIEVRRRNSSIIRALNDPKIPRIEWSCEQKAAVVSDESMDASEDLVALPDVASLAPPDVAPPEVAPPDVGSLAPPDVGSLAPPDVAPLAPPDDVPVVRPIVMRCEPMPTEVGVALLNAELDKLRKVNTVLEMWLEDKDKLLADKEKQLVEKDRQIASYKAFFAS